MMCIGELTIIRSPAPLITVVSKTPVTPVPIFHSTTIGADCLVPTECNDDVHPEPWNA